RRRLLLEEIEIVSAAGGFELLSQSRREPDSARFRGGRYGISACRFLVVGVHSGPSNGRLNEARVGTTGRFRPRSMPQTPVHRFRTGRGARGRPPRGVAPGLRSSTAGAAEVGARGRPTAATPRSRASRS